VTRLRLELEPLLHELLARPERHLDLDVIGDVIGAAAVSADDIDALFAALERHGRVVGDPTAGAASEALARVLATARELRREHGRVPSAAEIAARAGISVEVVRRALLFARVVQR
jgi:hypothetical protein